MSETIRRIVEDYGADYIKCDYNEDCGVGTDYTAFCAGEGLECCAQAFYAWIKEMTEKYPQVIFEGCSSGVWYVGSRSNHRYGGAGKRSPAYYKNKSAFVLGEATPWWLVHQYHLCPIYKT